MAFVFNEMFACFDKGCCPNGKKVSVLGSKVARPAGFAAYDCENGTTYKRPEYQRTDLDGDLQQVRTELFGSDPALPLDGRRTDDRSEEEALVPMSSLRKLNEVDENFDPNRPAPNPKGKLKSRFFDGKALAGVGVGGGFDKKSTSSDVPVQHPRVLSHTRQPGINKSVSPTGDPLNPGVARPEHPPAPSEVNTRVVFSSLTVQDASFNVSSRGGSLGQEHGHNRSRVSNGSLALSSDSWDSSFNRDGLVGPARSSIGSAVGSAAAEHGGKRRESSMSLTQSWGGRKESVGSTGSNLNASLTCVSVRTSDASTASARAAGAVAGAGAKGQGQAEGVPEVRRVAAIEEPRVGVGIVCFDRLDGSIAVDYVTQCSSVHGQVQSGDVIHSVNGRDVKGVPVSTVQALLFGPPFTHVLLGVSRPRPEPVCAPARPAVDSPNRA